MERKQTACHSYVWIVRVLFELSIYPHCTDTVKNSRLLTFNVATVLTVQYSYCTVQYRTVHCEYIWEGRKVLFRKLSSDYATYDMGKHCTGTPTDYTVRTSVRQIYGLQILTSVIVYPEATQPLITQSP